jgi:signal transduction histidine kinase
VTVLVLAVTAQIQVWSAPPAYDEAGRPLNAALALLYTLPLLAARRRPFVVLAVVLGASAIDFVLGGHGGQQWFALLIAVFSLGSYATQTASATGLTIVAAAVLAVDIPRLRDGDPIEEVLPGWFVLAGAWGLGAWLQHRRHAMRELAEEAEALVRDRDQATRAAVAYERARIARELHDLVAHAMAIIVLQAQAGGRVLDGDLEAARRAFADIEATGREGLTELRRLLDVLLVDLPDDELDPRPGLEQVERLAQRVRDAGLPVELSVTGEPRALPPGVDISAYRIVQEALTNTLKHAGRASASVGVAYRPGEVELSICDDGTAVPGARVPEGTGHGLIGMRERARLFGGSLDAGPSPTGGFHVRAVLPTGSP